MIFMLKSFLMVFSIFCLGQVSQVSSQSIPKDFQVTLVRTECFGTCPSYKLTIDADGGVVFEGINHVKMKGRHKGQISKEKIQLLMNEINHAKFFSLRNNYTSGKSVCAELVTDNPTTTTSLKMGGRSKTVQHYHGCSGPKVPKHLDLLEDKIDEIAHSIQWIK